LKKQGAKFMGQQNQTLVDIIAELSNSDARMRMQGIVALSKRKDANAHAIILVAQLLHDKATFDPNPGTYSPPFIPKFVPSVEACAKFFLPYIAKNSPRATLEAAMDQNDGLAAYDILANIGLRAMAKILIILDEDEVAKVCTELQTRSIPHTQLPILAAFSSLPEQRYRNVIACIASEDPSNLVNFPEDLVDVGVKAIPFLSEIIKFNAENSYGMGLAWKAGLSSVFHHQSVKYLAALKAISVLQQMGPPAQKALIESAQSPIKEIRSASEKALRKINVNPKTMNTIVEPEIKPSPVMQEIRWSSQQAEPADNTGIDQKTLVPQKIFYLPKAGDLVIGTIVEFSFDKWMVDIGSSVRAILSASELDKLFKTENQDLSKILVKGDHIVAKITYYYPPNEPLLTVGKPGLGKTTRGQILQVKPTIVPRIIDDKFHLIDEIKKETKCQIIVGLNGAILVVGKTAEDENRAIENFRKIENEY
jgi:hypothetical protein